MDRRSYWDIFKVAFKKVRAFGEKYAKATTGSMGYEANQLVEDMAQENVEAIQQPIYHSPVTTVKSADSDFGASGIIIILMSIIIFLLLMILLLFEGVKLISFIVNRAFKTINNKEYSILSIIRTFCI